MIKEIYHLLPMWVWEVILFSAVIDGFILYVAIGDFILEGVVDMKLPDSVFDALKWIAIVALPALSTFIVVLGKIWGWGDVAPMVAQTITAVATLLGALLGISTINYKKGDSE